MSFSDEQLLSRPVFIIGAPRSGTSFLGELISQHRSVTYADEPRFTWRYGNDAKSDLLRPGDARPEVREYIRRSFAHLVRQQDKTRLAEKMPSNSLRMGFIDRIFPDCRFVHIIRNGLDSVLSIRRYWQAAGGTESESALRPGLIRQRMGELSLRRVPYYATELLQRILPGRIGRAMGRPAWGPRIPGLSRLVKELDLLEVCSLQWRMCVEAACHYGRRLPPDRYYECRLEELSPQIVRAILAFGELDDDPGVIAYFDKHFDARAPGGRKPKAAAEDLDVIRQWIEPTQRWLGYPVENHA